jgi:hypothetical protein
MDMKNQKTAPAESKKMEVSATMGQKRNLIIAIIRLAGTNQLKKH